MMFLFDTDTLSHLLRREYSQSLLARMGLPGKVVGVFYYPQLILG